jgi:hypothetical protein
MNGTPPPPMAPMPARKSSKPGKKKVGKSLPPMLAGK